VVAGGSHRLQNFFGQTEMGKGHSASSQRPFDSNTAFRAQHWNGTNTWRRAELEAAIKPSSDAISRRRPGRSIYRFPPLSRRNIGAKPQKSMRRCRIASKKLNVYRALADESRPSAGFS